MIYVFIALFLVLQSLEALGTPNVGTVLFTKADVYNASWNADDVALLRARFHFQHLIPPFITPQEPNYVEKLFKYFKNGYVSISKASTDIDMDKILTLAFTDVLGGYMKMFALPVAKYAYYGGTLSKRDTLKLYLFYEDLKNYLGKNGTGWSAPDFTRLDTVTINVASPQSQIVRNAMEQDPCYYLSYFEKTPAGFSVPTPKIDWTSRTMFVPLANASLVDLHSTNATDALIKYYNVASNCLLTARPKKLDNFNQRFQLWLQEDVMPHLNDDRLYAPLQGVLSLVNNTYDAEAYQNLMKNYGTSNTRSTCREHSNKMKIIIAIVLFEILCCVPTVIYVMCRKGTSESGCSTSHVNMVFETRTDRSYSDCGLRLPRSGTVKRHGGLKWRQKPYAMMEAGEVNTSRSLHSMGTEMNECLLPEGYEDMATMVDEFLEQRKRNSCKDIQTTPRITRSATTGAPAKIETSDDTGKTVTLSSTTGPSKTTTVKIVRQTKKPACPTVTSTVIKSASPTRRAIPRYTKIDLKRDYKKELKKEYVKAKNSAATTAGYLKSEMFKETTDLVAAGKKIASKKVDDERKSKAIKIHTEERSIKIQGTNHPYLEIRIDRPQLELLSVGITRTEDTKESSSPRAPRVSKIPKRAIGLTELKAIRYKPPSESTPREAPQARKSMIPKLKRTHTADDSVIRTNTSSNVDKLNVTL